MPLPAGQFVIDKMPRFGLSQFAERFPAELSVRQLDISGDVTNPTVLSREIFDLPRVRQVSDFHVSQRGAFSSLNGKASGSGTYSNRLFCRLISRTLKRLLWFSDAKTGIAHVCRLRMCWPWM